MRKTTQVQNITFSNSRGLRPYRGNRSVRRHGRQAADFAAASAVVWNTAAAGMDAAEERTRPLGRVGSLRNRRRRRRRRWKIRSLLSRGNGEERERWEREGREGADMYSEFGVIWGGVSVGSMVISPKQVWHFDFIFSYKSTSVYHPKHFEDYNHGNSPSWGGPLL